jgi:MocE subfamily Rieske [2Fe-2S] domain protein
MNPISRFIYWNMNYHLEHHLFPLVPYHALPNLHEALKEYCPPPYPSILSAWRELLPAIQRQAKDPSYFVKRELPEDKEHADEDDYRSDDEPDDEGWLAVCDTAELKPEDVIRFDHDRKTFALYRIASGELFATDGVCTHGNTHLGNGLVTGELIECPKHNGRFNLRDGSPARTPICRGLATYPVGERNGRIWLNIEKAGGVGARTEKAIKLRVVSNTSVATFIKELVLEPVDASGQIEFTPGDYIQLNIPEYQQINFSEFNIPEPYATVWRNQKIFDLAVSNIETGRRNNYSLANNVVTNRQLKFNVRIATPPQGQDYPPGVGSSYAFSLKPGDEVTAIGPFGDFHIKPTQKEMVYIGGGAGMAPLRAHIVQLFENDKTARKVSYWYGARSRQEVFYENIFRELAKAQHNFNFHLALSEPLAEDGWEGKTGLIHEVVLAHYLKDHPNPRAVEYYLCGPPMLIQASTDMLAGLGVTDEQIAFDEF